MRSLLKWHFALALMRMSWLTCIPLLRSPAAIEEAGLPEHAQRAIRVIIVTRTLQFEASQTSVGTWALAARAMPTRTLSLGICGPKFCIACRHRLRPWTLQRLCLWHGPYLVCIHFWILRLRPFSRPLLVRWSMHLSEQRMYGDASDQSSYGFQYSTRFVQSSWHDAQPVQGKDWDSFLC